MNKKTLFIVLGFMIWALLPQASLADTIIGAYIPKEAVRNVGQCIYFKDFGKNLNYDFFVEMVIKKKDYEPNYRQYIEPIKDNVCYKVYQGSISRNYWGDAAPGTYFARIRMVDKKFVNVASYDKIVSANLNNQVQPYIYYDTYGRWFATALNTGEVYEPVWQAVDVISYWYAPGEDIALKGVSYFDVKSSSAIKSVSVVITFKSAATRSPSIYAEVADKDFNRTTIAVTPEQAMKFSLRGKDDAGRNLLAIGFKRDEGYKFTYEKQFSVKFNDGAEQIYSLNNFEKLLVDNRAEYNYVTEPYIHYNYRAYTLFDRIKPILQIVGLMFLSFFVEAIVMFFLGLRRIRKYLWLLLANIISYPVAVALATFLFSKIDSWTGNNGVFPDNKWALALFFWAVVEVAVFLIEYCIMWFGLRKEYTKRTIAKWVFLANAVTALLGLVISLYLIYK